MNIANLFQGISALAWLVAIAVVILIVIRAGRNNPLSKGGSILIGIIVIAIVLTTVSSGLVFINPEERGVVISAIQPQGYRQEALQPGLRWIIPFAESVVRYPISKQTYTMSSVQDEGQVIGDDSISARTSDGQSVIIDASVIFSVDPEAVVNIHIIWQDRYSDDLVRAISRGIVRDEVSQFGVEEVYSSKRLEMVTNVTAEMEDRLEENGLILSNFVLRNITFSPEYAASVEQKQIAEQTAQQAAFVVQQRAQEAEQARQVAQGKADAAVIASKGDAEARIINAEAEAESLLLLAEAIRGNTDLLTYQYITKLSPNIQALLLPNNAPFLFPLPELQSQSGGTTIQPAPIPSPSPAE